MTMYQGQKIDISVCEIRSIETLKKILVKMFTFTCFLKCNEYVLLLEYVVAAQVYATFFAFHQLRLITILPNTKMFDLHKYLLNMHYQQTKHNRTCCL